MGTPARTLPREPPRLLEALLVAAELPLGLHGSGATVPTLKGLRPYIRPSGEWLVRLGRTVDRSLAVTSVRRTHAEQARLYDAFLQGKSKLPALPPGHSMHEVGRAFDMARPDVDPFQDSLLQELGAVWVSLGGRWSRTDPVHFEA